MGAELSGGVDSSVAAAELLGATRLSPIHETEPWGNRDQPMFLNAVAEVETDLSPRALLARLPDRFATSLVVNPLLTEKELVVLRHLARGESNKTIARALEKSFDDAARPVPALHDPRRHQRK